MPYMAKPVGHQGPGKFHGSEPHVSPTEALECHRKLGQLVSLSGEQFYTYSIGTCAEPPYYLIRY
jgi:hypothetical protein